MVEPGGVELVGCAYDQSYYERGDDPDGVGYRDYFGTEAAGAAPYDVVTLIDVVEHLPDPVTTLRGAVELTRAGGAVVVLTPRYGGRLLADQDAAYVHFNSDHTLYFTVLSGLGADIPEAVVHKYGVERDSMLAYVRV
jgi:hypothetical protein